MKLLLRGLRRLVGTCATWRLCQKRDWRYFMVGGRVCVSRRPSALTPLPCVSVRHVTRWSGSLFPPPTHTLLRCLVCSRVQFLFCKLHSSVELPMFFWYRNVEVYWTCMLCPDGQEVLQLALIVSGGRGEILKASLVLSRLYLHRNLQ